MICRSTELSGRGPPTSSGRTGPLAPFTPNIFQPYWARYGSGLDGETSMVTIDASTQAVVALSLVTPDAWDGRTMIVSETVHEDQPDGDRLLRATVAASLSRLAARGHDRVELEGHSTDAHSPQLVRSLPPAGGDPMDVLKLLPPRGNL